MVLQTAQRGLSWSRAFLEAAQQPWEGRFYSPDTIAEWLYRFRHGQFAALYDQPRSDKGQKRALIRPLLRRCSNCADFILN